MADIEIQEAILHADTILANDDAQAPYREDKFPAVLGVRAPFRPE